MARTVLLEPSEELMERSGDTARGAAGLPAAVVGNLGRAARCLRIGRTVANSLLRQGHVSSNLLDAFAAGTFDG